MVIKSENVMQKSWPGGCSSRLTNPVRGGEPRDQFFTYYIGPPFYPAPNNPFPLYLNPVYHYTSTMEQIFWEIITSAVVTIVLAFFFTVVNGLPLQPAHPRYFVLGFTVFILYKVWSGMCKT